MSPSRVTLCRAVGRLACLGAALGAGGCGKAVSRDSAEARRSERAPREAHAPASAADTAPFVVRQTGAPMESASAVMQVIVTGTDARIAVSDPHGRVAMAGGGDHASADIPGSRVSAEDRRPGDAAPGDTAADIVVHVAVRVPALAGERFLLEVEPYAAETGMTMVSLTADGMALAALPVPIVDGADGAALFELLVTSRGLEIGPRIETVEVVPTCATSHLVRNGGRGGLYAQFQVVETGESGDVHLPPRPADARFRGTSFRTRTRGTVRITYLGRELATAPLPEGCPAP